MSTPDPLDLFLPPVRQWFRTTLGEPTPPQRAGWPLIAAGRSTLILAPTGSGKTLAAFLACLDHLWRQQPVGGGGEAQPRGVRVLYVSPLKALNNDIYRNLQLPLAGVAETARQLGHELPTLELMVRTGDTPAAERARLLRRPPHILITTPESLHLLLTSRARDTLTGVTHVIVDEIHALCPNKRGVFLALLLERLQALNPRGFVRIGLSATQRPLETVAAYLGGQDVAADGTVTQRPVAVVDAGLRKDLDLRVVSPVEHFGPLPEKTIWPSIYRLLGEQIRGHRSTIVFANNRRSVERITAHLNQEPEAAPRQPENPNFLAAPADPETPLARAHHGSVSLEVRQHIEQALKEGRLPAVVATASLELGIDMGPVDLVCQVESPGNVARGLQRVGRAGHLVGQRSKGRLVAKTLMDLLEQAVLAHEMVAGRVEEIRVPTHCLDVLAQQVVAMTAMEPWDVPALYALVRRAFPYRDLAPAAFEAVLEMASGRYRFAPRGEDEPASGPGASASTLVALQPRVSWDRVHNRLLALPGSQSMALQGGGTIPDTGQYAVLTPDGTRLGELDEEFIYERRVGDAFLLGTNAWRVQQIEADRVIVTPAEGAPALIPFWRGEQVGRSYDLGLAIGQFLRDLAGRLKQPQAQARGEAPALALGAGHDAETVAWLQRDYLMDLPAAKSLRMHVQRQLDRCGALPTDKTLIIEASRDQLGDWQVVLLSPFGSRLHLALRLALEARLRQRLGYAPQCLHHDNGVLVRLTDSTEPVLDLLDGLTPENLQDHILPELADSPLFALRFRQNAARALLMPRTAGKRAPLWLQRLRGRDLLQVARRHPDFPVIAETFRECLHDHLDLPRLQQLLADIRDNRVEVVTQRLDSPSPFAASLLFAFTMAYMYQYDGTEAEPNRTQQLDRQLLDQILAPDRHGHLLDPRAVRQVEGRLRGLGLPPRTGAEMAEWLRRLGDLAASDLHGPMAAFLADLETAGVATQIELPRVREPRRWILTEERDLYQAAFGQDAAEAHAAAQAILHRFLETHALVSLADVLGRYPFDAGWARRQLEEWAQSGRLVPVPPASAAEPTQWAAPANLEQLQRSTLALLRREVVTVPPTQFADFVARWQFVHPETRPATGEGLTDVLGRLQGVLAPAELWEQTLLPARVPGYEPRHLDEALAGGAWTWACQSGSDGLGSLAFLPREQLAEWPAPAAPEVALDEGAERVRECLRQRGALFVTDLAAQTTLAPSAVRAALNVLLGRGLVGNDRFDVIRTGNESPALATAATATAVGRWRATPRRTQFRPEGRWFLIPWGSPDTETLAVRQATLLLNRFGFAARELAQMDPWLLPWRVLYEVLSRMEMAGSVRRGYFAEGLSGAQFALPEAAQLLQEVALPSSAAAPVLLLHSLDPTNLYGAGAPFDVALLDGGTRSLSRRAGNWLVQCAGRPVLLIEQQGKRLTALASASREEVAAAVACLPQTLSRHQRRDVRHRLTVNEWNGQPVTATPGRDFLEAAGFVRDYQSMTWYAAWH
jgi:ATP-dependent Lhr-like helicase